MLHRYTPLVRIRNRKGVGLYLLAVISALLCFQVARPHFSHSCSTEPQGFDAEAIRCRIELARSQYRRANQSSSAEEAVVEYRRRYRREPPKGFSDWVQFALSHDSMIIDDFDQIDADLQPFRTSEARQLFDKLNAGSEWEALMRMETLDGAVNISGAGYGYATAWQQLTSPFAKYLPAGVYYLNVLDEARVLASAEAQNDIVFHNRAGAGIEDLIDKSCQTGLHQSNRLVQQKDVCQVLHPAASHGFVASPDSFSYTYSLVPIMSIGRMSPFRDVLIPCPCYMNQEILDDDPVPFVLKKPALYWRGSSTGLLATKATWRSGHRQRFVAFIRSLQEAAQLFDASRLLGAWVGKVIDVKKVKLFKNLFNVGMGAYIQCEDEAACAEEEDYLGTSFHEAANASSSYRYVFDLDGNSMSTRFYRLLSQHSVVLKQTLFQEWHDDRLAPWIHYIPISLEMTELPEIMSYLVGNPEGVRYSEEIANTGYEWSRKVVRKTDMTIYMYRLMLELSQLFEPGDTFPSQ